MVMTKETSGPDQLIYLFSKLPGLGTRSARRIVLHLLQDKDLRLNDSSKAYKTLLLKLIAALFAII